MARPVPGKTWIAEKAIHEMLREGKRCWYASPLKALIQRQVGRVRRLFENITWASSRATHEGKHGRPISWDDGDPPNQLTTHAEGRPAFDLVSSMRPTISGDEERAWSGRDHDLPAGPGNLPAFYATIENDARSPPGSRPAQQECAVIEERRRPFPSTRLFLHPTGRSCPFSTGRRLYGRWSVRPATGQTETGGRGISRPTRDFLRALKHFNLLRIFFPPVERAECDNASKSCRNITRPSSFEFEELLQELIDRTAS